MVLPYLPGRFDASASTLSGVVQIGSYASVAMVPVGLAWMINCRRSALWHRLALMLAGLVAFTITSTLVFGNQLAMGAIIGVGAIIHLRTLYQRSRVDLAHVGRKRNPVSWYLVSVPV